MAESFDELGQTGIFDEGPQNSAHVQDEMYAKKLEFDKIFLDCYATPQGKRMFDTLRERFVERPIYHRGDTIEEVAYRQGQYDLVVQMEASVEDALTPPTKKR